MFLRYLFGRDVKLEEVGKNDLDEFQSALARKGVKADLQAGSLRLAHTERAV